MRSIAGAGVGQGRGVVITAGLWSAVVVGLAFWSGSPSVGHIGVLIGLATIAAVISVGGRFTWPATDSRRVGRPGELPGRFALGLWLFIIIGSGAPEGFSLAGTLVTAVSASAGIGFLCFLVRPRHRDLGSSSGEW